MNGHIFEYGVVGPGHQANCLADAWFHPDLVSLVLVAFTSAKEARGSGSANRFPPNDFRPTETKVRHCIAHQASASCSTFSSPISTPTAVWFWRAAEIWLRSVLSKIWLI